MSSFYSFTDLQEIVEEVFDVEIDPEGGDFKAEQIKYRLQGKDIENVEFEDGDIFYHDGDSKYKGFLVKEENYRRAYYDYEIGRKSHLPKFHTTDCDTLRDMKRNGRFDGVYIFSNEPEERTEAAEGGGMKSDLRVCKNCLKKDQKINKIIYTQQFVEEHLNSDEEAEGSGFIKNELPKQFEKDEWGYVNGWDGISLRYRAKKNFTCEECGLDLSNDKYYLEVHHINSNKTDNRESNLKCLCTGCHANIDRFHRENYYNQYKNNAKLKEFIKLFR